MVEKLNVILRDDATLFQSNGLALKQDEKFAQCKTDQMYRG